jgi:hypothetical protein
MYNIMKQKNIAFHLPKHQQRLQKMFNKYSTI